MPGLRTWIFFYLLSFVGLLWAAFLTITGIMLWVSMTLIIVVIGVNLMTVMGEIKKHADREKMQKSFSEGIDKTPYERRKKIRK